MCRLWFSDAIARLLVLCLCMGLYMLVPSAILGLAAWPLIWLLWQRLAPDDRLPIGSILQLLPFAIAVQVTLDSLVPFLGDVVVLIANVAMVATLARSKIPRARVHQR